MRIKESAMQTTQAIESSAHRESPRGSQPRLTLDDLLALDAPALEQLYRGASVPCLETIQGDLRGRMLAVLPRRPSWDAWLRVWAGTAKFPWRGKSFTPLGADAGRGINRAVVDSVRVFPFRTFVGKSRAGDFDCVQLDYDLPENPFFIRAIQDEIRELSSGLYLGQAYLAASRPDAEARLVLYFALSAA